MKIFSFIQDIKKYFWNEFMISIIFFIIFLILRLFFLILKNLKINIKKY